MDLAAAARETLDAVEDDFATYCAYALNIATKSGDIRPFVLNDEQKYLHERAQDQLKRQGYVRLLILKARQWGGSTYVEARGYGMTSRQENQTGLVMAHRDDSSTNLFRMIQRFHEHDEVYRPQTKASNAKELVFAQPYNSRYMVHTAGKTSSAGVGRSFSYRFVHCSEVAWWGDMGAHTMGGLLEAVPSEHPAIRGTEVFWETTANGYDPLFYSKWDEVSAMRERGEPSEWELVFIPWYWHKAYSLELDEDQRKQILETLTDYEKWLMRQERRDGTRVTTGQIAWRRQKIVSGTPPPGLSKLQFFKQEYPACLTAEVRVSTEEGIIPISKAGASKETESGPVAAWGEQKPSEIWRLETSGGRVLRGTGDHPVQTSDGLVALSDLAEGVQITLRPPRFAAKPYTVKWEGPFSSKRSVAVTQQLGRFIGYFMGDGSWYAGTVSVVCDAKDLDVVADVRRLMSKFFHDPKDREHKRVQGRKGAVELRVGDIAAQETLYQVGLLQNNGNWKRKVCVPECIWRSPESVVREFLRGLFEADGSASNRCVRWASSKAEFARDVQLLLLGFGFNVPIEKNTKIAGSGHIYTSYVLHLTVEDSRRFHDEIGFISKRKRSGRPNVSTDGRGRKSEPRPLVDYVRSVERDGFEPTWDFTLDTDDHLFSAQGILTHNTASEAFQATGSHIFDLEKVEQWRQEAPEPERRYDFLLESGEPIYKEEGKLKVWEEPDPMRSYIIGADVAEGLEHGDYSSADVIDHHNGDVVAKWHGDLHPADFGKLLAHIGRRYNNAWVGVERNNHGLTTITRLQDLGYKRLYVEEAVETPGAVPRKRYGWLTSKKTKPMMVDTLIKLVEEEPEAIKDRETWGEMLRFERHDDGTYGAQEGHNDDRLMSLAIARELRRLLPTPKQMAHTREQNRKTGAAPVPARKRDPARKWKAFG